MENNQERRTRNSSLRTLTAWLVVIGLGAFTSVFLYGAVVNIVGSQGAWLIDIARAHFATTIGLPFAALAALSLVLILEFRAGKIEFEGFGFKFKGASGPIILWIISFLAIASAIKMTW